MEVVPASKRDRRIGVIAIIAPFLTLFLVLAGWGVASFLLSLTIDPDVGDVTRLMVWGRVLNTVLGFVGILSVICIPLGFVIGLYFLLKKASPEPGQKL